MRNSMRLKITWFIAASVLSLLVAISAAQTGAAQKRKTVMITRLYTGSDGLTHAEEVEVKFTPGSANDVYKMMGASGAQLSRGPAGRVSDWHTAPRRQYVITLSGRGELEVAGGIKIPVEPGHIELVEDTTGKGHITRVVGTEDRVTLQIPISDH